MLTRLQVNNLRGLRSLNIEDAGLVNIIVGPNNAGKSTVLEAIRLLVTADPRALKRRSRNMLVRQLPSLRDQYLLAFYDRNPESQISLSGSIGGHEIGALVRIQIVAIMEANPLLFEFSEDDDLDDVAPSLVQRIDELIIDVNAGTDEDSPRATITLSLSEGRKSNPKKGKRTLEGGPFPNLPTVAWMTTERKNSWVYASRYSSLVRKGLEGRLIEVLQGLEPKLQGLLVLVDSENEPPVLEADFGGGLRLPMESLGDGFTSALAIISAIASTPQGLCLIDEIENGIYYESQTEVWKAVHQMAELGQTQVWATTHSLECIEAAYRAFAEAGSTNLRVHRLERIGQETTCTTLGWEDLASAFKFNMEVR